MINPLEKLIYLSTNLVGHVTSAYLGDMVNFKEEGMMIGDIQGLGW